MSLKSLIQILILALIVFIIAVVYYKYFDINKDFVEEKSSLENANQKQLKELESKILELESKNNELVLKFESGKSIKNKSLEDNVEKITNDESFKKDEVIINEVRKLSDTNKKNKQNNEVNLEEIKNLVKDVEYRSIDQKGNNFYLLANSGKSNINDNDILDLVNVRGEITSDYRDTIYIVSDFAQFNSVNSNSKFYDNVVINYQDKEITCVNFDINMETNKALAYNNVIITDPKSIMKAGLVEFDLKTKNININPESTTTDIQVIAN